MLKNKLSKSLVFGLMALVGLGSGVAIMASAQSVITTAPVNTTTTAKAQTVDTPEVGDAPDATGSIDTPEPKDKADVVGEHTDKAGDSDGGTASEVSEPSGSSNSGE